MNHDPRYRQEHIYMLRTHSEQIEHHSARAQAQRKALKLRQREEISATGTGLKVLKRIFLSMRHISEIKQLNLTLDTEHARLRESHREEIQRLKLNWMLRQA